MMARRAVIAYSALLLQACLMFLLKSSGEQQDND